MKPIAIIGNGVSGVTTARHIRKNNPNVRIVIISSETEYFFSRTALMYVYMGHMKFENIKPYEDFFWEKNRLELIHKHVDKVDTDTKTLSFSDGGKLEYEKLVIASGSKTSYFNWRGQSLKGVQGLYSYQDLESMELHTKDIERAVIVGGGLIGVEMAEMLHSRHIPVTFLVRESLYWNKILPNEEAKMIGKHIREEGIDLRLGEEMQEILDDGAGRVRGILTKSGEEIAAQFVGIATGVTPNVEFLKDSGIAIDKGILVNEYLETNKKDVYAIGDCAQFHTHPTGRKPIEQVWYTGKMMGETLAQTLTGKRTHYKPGVWYNSAKFFDIEYQTYGEVNAQQKDTEEQFFWKHEGNEKCIRLCWNKQDGSLIGVHALGIRLRHEVADMWINQKWSIDKVMEQLGALNFDPELYESYEQQIISAYNAQFGKNIKLKRKKSGAFLMNIFR